MYFTSFHKAIFREIWKSRDSKKDFDLESLLEFYNKWHKNKFKKEIYDKIEGGDEFVFSGYYSNTENGKQYLIKQKAEKKVLIALREIASVLKHLNDNDLINIVEKPKRQHKVYKKSDANAKCIALYIKAKNENVENKEGEEVAFQEALEIVKDYIGKNIQVREGFRKFRRFWYCSQDEIMRLLVGVWLPLILAFLTFFLNKLFSSDKNIFWFLY
jgi:hypothetical protein